MAYKMVAHAAKFKRDNLKGARMHNERLTKQHSNKDIDVTRSYLNYSLVDRRPESYAKQVNRLLNSDRKPRKDAVYDVEFVFGSDGKYMLSLDAKQQRKYFQTCMDYVADKWGKDRILYADVHLDETSPHMHMGAAPIDHDGHLAAKNLFDRKFLLTMQDELPARLAAAGFDIERGNPGGVHTTKKQWQKVTKEANEQVIETLSRDFPDYVFPLKDKAGHVLKNANGAVRYSPLWGTPDGKDALRKRPLEVNTRSLTFLTHKQVKESQDKLEAAKTAQEAADKDKAAADAERKALAVDNARAAELSRKALAAQKKVDEEKAEAEKKQAANDVREASLDTREDGLYSREMALNIRERGLDDREGKLDAQEKRVTAREDELHAVVAAGLPYVMGHDDDGRSNADLFKSRTFFRGGVLEGRHAGYPSLFDAFVDGRFKVDGKTGAEHLFSRLQNVPVSQRARMQQDVNQAREKSRQTTETATAEPDNDGPEL